MRIRKSSNSVVSDKIERIRNRELQREDFRRLVKEISTLISLEILDLENPKARFGQPTEDAVVIPVLRAGLGMLEGFCVGFPEADVGFIGISRDEHTLQSEVYLDKVPQDLNGKLVFCLDPMLATGGSLIQCLDLALSRGSEILNVVSILAAPEGIEALENHVRKSWSNREVNLFVGSIDERLDSHGFIVPGLGDAGDRLFGTC